MITISIIIVAYKNKSALKRCLKSIPAEKHIEIIVIDNAKINRGFGKACNLGAKQAKGEIVFFLNPDTEISKDAIDTLYKKLLSDTSIGLIAPQLLDVHGLPYLSYTKQPTYIASWIVYSVINRLLPNNPYTQRYWYHGKSLQKTRYVESISGAAMMMRKTYFKELGGFDHRFFMYWEDADLCRRIIKDGKKIMYLPKAKIMHQKAGNTPSQKRAKRWFIKSRYQFFSKHFGTTRALPLELFLRLQENWQLSMIVISLVIVGFLYVI